MYIEGIENKEAKNLIKSIKSSGLELEDYINSLNEKGISFENKEDLIKNNVEIVINNKEISNENSYNNSRLKYER